MDSPVRKMLKKNDYARHKLLRKIKRLRKARLEQEKKAAEKELKRKLRWTPPKFEDGKPKGWVRANGNDIMFDEEGNLVDQITGERGTMVLPELSVTPGPKYEYRSAYHPEDAFEFAGTMMNAPFMLADRALQEFGVDGDYVLTAADAVGKTLSPTRYINAARTGFLKSIYDDDLPTLFGDRNLDMLFDIMTAPKAVSKAKEILKSVPEAHQKWATKKMAEWYAKHPAEKFLRTGESTGGEIAVNPDGSIKVVPGEYTGATRNGTRFARKALDRPQDLLPVEQDVQAQRTPGYESQEYVNPELVNDYMRPGRPITYKLENGKLYSSSETGVGTTRIKPKRGQIQETGWNVGDVVDENGNIDTGYAVSALRSVLDRIDNPAIQYHYRTFLLDATSDGNKTRTLRPVNRMLSTLRHLYEAAKTAQSAPVAKGSTKQQLVFAALSHDIAEIKDRDLHGEASAELLRNMFNSVPERTLSAIERHMLKNKPFSKDPILKALALADNASGRTYLDYILDHPLEGYAKEVPVRNKGFEKGISTREEVKTRINPVLKQYGYDTIPLDIPEELQREMLKKIIDQHRTFLRGASDPDNIDIYDHKKFKYLQEVRRKAQDYFKTDNPTRLQLIQYIAEHTSPRSAYGKGTMGMSDLSKYLYSDLNDANYYSNSLDVSAGYAGKTGESSWVKLPEPQFSDDMSMAEMWETADFPLYSTARRLKMPGQSEKLRVPWRTKKSYDYGLPYRLHTGRSLDADVQKEFANDINRRILNDRDVQLAMDRMRRSLYTDPQWSKETFPQISSDGSIHEAPIPLELSAYALKNIENVEYINSLIKNLHPNSTFSIRPNKEGQYKHSMLILKYADKYRLSLRTVDALDDIISKVNLDRSSWRNIVSTNMSIQQLLNDGMFSKKQKGYITTLLNTLNKMARIGGVGIGPFGELVEVDGGSDVDMIHKNSDLIKELSKILKRYVETYRYLLKNRMADDFSKTSNEVRRNMAVIKADAVKRILPDYYKKMLEKEGIVPMHQLDAAQTSPIIFTTERRKANLNKASETKAKKYDKEKGKTGSRFNRFAHESYQHYVIPAPHGTKVMEFEGFEEIPYDQKPHQSSSHVGRRHDKASHKIR